MPYVISIDEQTYGRHLDEKIAAELTTDYNPPFRRLMIDDIFKMIAISLNLFKLFPLYPTPYYLTEDIEKLIPSPPSSALPSHAMEHAHVVSLHCP